MESCCGFRKEITTYGICINQYGSLETSLTIQKVILPIFGPDDILIEVKASSINAIDWKIAESLMQNQLPIRFPYILGRDFAGIVKKVGINVLDIHRGDKVYGYQPAEYNGALSQLIIVNKQYVSKLDQYFTYDEAVSIPFSGGLAYHVLKDILKIQNNTKLWITNASGSVGSWAVQIAKELGAIVIGTTSTENKGWLRKLGADEVIDYKLMKSDQYPKNIDCIFDTRGNLNEIDITNCVINGGKIVSIVDDIEPINTKMANINFYYYNMHAPCTFLPKLVEWIKDGKLKQQIRKKYSFLDVMKGFQASKTGHINGKIIITIDEKDIFKAFEMKEEFFKGK